MNKLGRNKRLGQYFTSQEVARLLLKLAVKLKPDISDAIDPMMGQGVFIKSIKELDTSIETYGIELDNSLIDFVSNRFNKDDKLVFGSAFDSKVIEQFNKNQFDLVITNPPYVRHLNQTSETLLENGLRVPSGSKVKEDLIDSIQSNREISLEEKEFLIETARNYSGLSDLSIPSIIQCAALTKENGILALLIPESCISREYSLTTLNVLFKLFEIKIVVKDEGRNWFDDAQVKTLLIVGNKLKKPRVNVLSHPEIPVVEIRESTPESPLGNKGETMNYDTFASRSLNSQITDVQMKEKYFRSVHSFIAPLMSQNNLKSFPQFRELNSRQEHTLDPRLTELANCSDYHRLDNLLLDVHQGLRTGANKFFYCELVKEGATESIVAFNINDHIKEIQIPNKLIRPVLRKQKEITTQNSISKKNLKGRLLDLKNSFTSSDISKFKLLGNDIFKLSNELSEHIEYCSKVNIGSSNDPKYFPELSAVRTNVSLNIGSIKTWYQIPDLKARHIPDICIPRVNTSFVKPFIVEKGVVVDANFITVNVSPNSPLSKYGLLALFKSDWISLQLELYGNTLGGGALKLDRNHLLNIIFPQSILVKNNRLEKLGEMLIESPDDEKVVLKINELVNSALGIKDSTRIKNKLSNRLKLRTKNG
jgi:predicted RNA methylase